MRRKLLLILTIFVFQIGAVAQAQFSERIQLNLLGSYQSNVFDEGAAEIGAFDPTSGRLFTTNADANTIDIIDLDDPANPSLINTIDLSSLGGGPNSVDVYTDGTNTYVAVAIEADIKQDPGVVAFYDTTGSLLNSVQVGPLPDMLVISSDGNTILVANEGEPNDDYSVDPEGSVSIIDASAGVAAVTTANVTTADFNSFDSQKQQLIDNGVRIFGGVSPFTGVLGFDANDGTVKVDADLINDYENLFATLQVTIDGENESELFRIAAVSVADSTFTLANFDEDITAVASVNVQNGTSTVSQDLEPEYIAFNGDETKAWVALQENNAVAILDVASGTFDNVVSLGTKDHSQLENAFDGSHKDGGININPWPTKGMYMPDAITSYTVDGNTYFVTANEGDAREYDTYLEELDLEDQNLDQVVFENADVLQSDSGIGPLTTSIVGADGNGDGTVDEIFSFGARSFSIWNSSGELVFDSGDQFEKITARELGPNGFNNDNDEQDPDSRSDNKGPEPEAVNIYASNGKYYAFVALERVGGIMVYDVTDPAKSEFVSYTTSRNFADVDESNVQSSIELGPEDIKFVKATESPNGKALAIIPHEVTGSVSIYEIVEQKISIAEARATDDGTDVTVEGIVTRVMGDFTYVQDETGAITVRATSGDYFDAVGNGEINIGDLVRYTGEKDSFSGLEQINDNNVIFEVISTDNVLPEPSLVTLAEISSNGEDYEGQLVRVNGLTIDPDGDTDFQGSTNYTVTGPNSETGTLRVPGADDSEVDGKAFPDASFNFVGVLGQFNNFGSREDDFGYQLLAIDTTDFQTTFTLALLHNNDGESQLINAGSGELEDFGGVARFKTLSDNLKQNAFENGWGVVQLSSGDNYLAGPEFNAGLDAGIFYDARAINLIGYDALAIGNHEFDFGPDVLADFISAFETGGVKTKRAVGTDGLQAVNPGTPPPFLSANLDFSAEENLQRLVDSGRIGTRRIIEVNGEKIGVVGATTSNLRSISSPRGVEVLPNIAELVQAEVDALTLAGVNKIILISHLQSIREDSLLAADLTDIDIMIAGGGDELLANDGDLLLPGDEDEVSGAYPLVYQNEDNEDVLVVTGRGGYSYLGQLVVDFDENGVITNVRDESGPKRVSGTGEDAVTENQQMLDEVVTPVENFLADLGSNVIAQSEVVLDGRRSALRTQETNQGNLVADALLWQGQELAAEFGVAAPQVALQNGGGVRNDSEIAAGDITELQTFDILPFSNFVTVFEEISAAELKAILENAVSRVEFTSGRFAQVAGMRYAFDPEAEPRQLDDEGNVEVEGERILFAELDDGTILIQNGEVVDEEATVSLATIDFLARGGDDYPFGDNPFTLLGVSYQQALFNYITEGLGGEITANDYPEGGEGRILELMPMTIAEARAPELADKAVAFEGIVTRTAARIFFIQDETGAIGAFQSSGNISDALANGDIREGDLIRVWADRADFAGLAEIGDSYFAYEIASRNNPLPNAQIVTLDELSDGATAESFESEIIAVNNLTIDPAGDTEFQSSTSYTVTDADDNTFVLRTPSGSENADIVGTTIPTGPINFRGLLGQFDNFSGNLEGYQLSPWRATDVRAAGDFKLTILHNNDGESQLLNAGSGLEAFGGIARFKTLVDSLRFAANQDGGSVMLSSGDNFLAGPEFNVSLNDERFYDAIGLRLIDYDAVALGNHDFDFGPDLLADFIREVNGGSEMMAKLGISENGIAEIGQPPVYLSANLDFSGETALDDLVGEGKLAKSTTISVNGDIVGVIGATTPNLDFISSPGDVGINDDVATAVQAEIDALENEGVNKIILISHLQGIAEDSTLATELSGIDVVIAGGGDELLSNSGDLLVPGDEDDQYGSYPITATNLDGDEVPIVTTTGSYKYVGRLVVEFDENGKITLVDETSGPVRVAGGSEPDSVSSDMRILEEVVDPVQRGVDALAENIIANTEVVLDGERNDVRSRETNQGNMMADAYLWQANQLASQFAVDPADIGIANGGGIRNDSEIPVGPITELNTFDMAPFGNIMTIIEGVDPNRFKLMMENAVSRISLQNGDPMASGSGTGRFAQISGFEIEYNPNLTALELDGDGNVETEGSRIWSITLDDGTQIVANGQVVDGAPSVNVATGDFTARGGDQYPFDGLDFTLLGVTDQRSLFNYMTAPTADGGLGGTVTAAQYPEGGEGRTAINTSVSNEPRVSDLPTEFALEQNYPNPFNPSTNITYALPQGADVRLTVYDLLGREVAVLINNTRQSAGFHTVSFDASRLSSGMYLYRIEAGNFVQTKKMMLIK